MRPLRHGSVRRGNGRAGKGPQGIIDHDTIPEYHGVRTDTYTYVEYVDGEHELYDLRRDPYELRNVYGGGHP